MKKVLFGLMVILLMGMGWLNPYEYGHPKDGATEPDVKVQFVFEDEGPDIVDEVAGFTMKAQGPNIEYRVDTSSYSRKMPYGIKVPVPGVAAYFDKPGSSTEFALGTDDATFEIVYTAYKDLREHGSTLVETLNSANNSGYRLHMAGNTEVIEMTVWAIDGSVVQARWVSPEAFNIGDHKLRVVLDRDADQKLFVDGIEQTNSTGTSMAAIFDKPVLAHNVYLGFRTNGGFVWPAIWNEFRLSGNATNNSGGPNGG